jgi:hypothetical protein
MFNPVRPKRRYFMARKIVRDGSAGKRRDANIRPGAQFDTRTGTPRLRGRGVKVATRCRMNAAFQSFALASDGAGVELRPSSWAAGIPA